MIGRRWRSDRRGGDPIGGGALNDRQPRNAGQEGRQAAEGRCRRGSEGTGIPIGIGIFPSLSLSFPSFFLGTWQLAWFAFFFGLLACFFRALRRPFSSAGPCFLTSISLFVVCVCGAHLQLFEGALSLFCTLHTTSFSASPSLPRGRSLPPPPTVPPPILLSPRGRHARRETSSLNGVDELTPKRITLD